MNIDILLAGVCFVVVAIVLLYSERETYTRSFCGAYAPHRLVGGWGLECEPVPGAPTTKENFLIEYVPPTEACFLLPLSERLRCLLGYSFYGDLREKKAAERGHSATHYADV
jgi:hypothetical protein